jgi:FkbM family methyltransferase
MVIIIMLEKALQALRSHLGLGTSIERRSLLGKQISIRYGVVRDKPDYDDGWLYLLIHQSRNYLDVGCNNGTELLVSALDDPNRPMVAIDANPKALAIAAETLILNGLSGGTLFVPAFVGASDTEEVDFYTVGSGAAGSRYSSHARSASASRSFFHLRSRTLDAITEEGKSEIDLIKIDVEGAEQEVLAGARRLCSRRRPRFVVEMHALAERSMAENGESVLSWCREAGYDAYYLREHSKVESSESFAHRGRCHLLLLPAGSPYPDELIRIQQGTSVEAAWELIGQRLS